MKVLTIIIFLGMVQLAQLALAETYNCPDGQSNALEPGQTIQTSGQPRCDKATGFSEGLCPTRQITGTTYYLPSETNPEGWSEYKMFYNCADKGFSTKHTLVNGLSVLICGSTRIIMPRCRRSSAAGRAPARSRSPWPTEGCCFSTSCPSSAELCANTPSLRRAMPLSRGSGCLQCGCPPHQHRSPP
jgi:hypothetical protein